MAPLGQETDVPSIDVEEAIVEERKGNETEVVNDVGVEEPPQQVQPETPENEQEPLKRTKTVESSEESEEEDIHALQGKMVTALGEEVTWQFIEIKFYYQTSRVLLQIDRSSAGNMRRTKEEVTNDPEDEDEFGYTMCEYLKNLLHGEAAESIRTNRELHLHLCHTINCTFSLNWEITEF